MPSLRWPEKGSASKFRKYQDNKVMAENDAKIDAEAEVLSEKNGAILINAGTPQATYIAKTEWVRRKKEEARKAHFSHIANGKVDRTQTPGEVSTSGQGISTNGMTPDEQMLEADKLLGLPLGMTKAQYMQESSGDNSAISGKGARGAFGIMPNIQATLEGRANRKFNSNNFNDSLHMRNMLMSENLKRFHGNIPESFKHYVGGDDESKWGPQTNGYFGSIQSRMANMHRSSFGGDEHAGGQVVTIIVRSAENKFQPERVTVKLHGKPQSSTSGAPHSLPGHVA